MNITVKIECESIADFIAHLDELQKQVKHHAKKLKLDINNDEFDVSVADNLYDNNCYGIHEVTMFKEV